MKFLILSAVLAGACLAQGPQRRQEQYDNDQQQYQEPQKPQYNQQYQEQRPRSHESTTFIPIIRFDKEQGNDGSYKAAWETGNNIIAQEEGYVKDLGPDPDVEGQHLNAQVQQGSYTYTSPEGQVITVNYIADEKGFHPSGDHLPTPPPVSPEVQKGLDLIFAGIKAQQEAEERETRQGPQGQRNNPPPQDYNGQYRQQ
ncbi:endocuticle structural glycoprotein SgAbd-8 [Tribolium castaneum]|uniref:Pupal cuticle protein Edg-78E-like Protein n=1 Tax=Tribolium castaneum TaxID=7070 RepID=D6WNK3_TRICA|nr:PREDICTED: endocuticle structural glycoprotein SgAbd-8 [Tribolium castaneum]EFA03218.1 Pupal cuticle protein Edg-78E-like Protein [Tribolium castaneum]|eukprot:XP_973697.1 PREDICTED: endocuticle structural glycoprotein SgAbd-8 [Tribolium castaneum]